MITVISEKYRDAHNAYCSRRLLVVNGKRYAMPDVIGGVYSVRQWKGGAEPVLSRGDACIILHGTVYRVGSKSAKPLKLKKGERYIPGRRTCVFCITHVRTNPNSNHGANQYENQTGP